MPETIRADFNDENSFRDHLQKIKEILDRGGIVVFPTDTFYGLGVNPLHRQAVLKVFEAKERPLEKPLPVLVSSRRQVKELTGEIPLQAEKLMDQLWPGPLTLLFKARAHLPKEVTADTGKIGVRLPGSAFTRNLIAGLGHPLTAPSANISGAKEPATAQAVAETLRKRVDLILDAGPTPGGKASTVLDTTVSPPAIIREGAVPQSTIESILETRCASA